MKGGFVFDMSRREGGVEINNEASFRNHKGYFKMNNSIQRGKINRLFGGG